MDDAASPYGGPGFRLPTILGLVVLALALPAVATGMDAQESGDSWIYFVGAQAGRRSLGGPDFDGDLLLRHVDQEILVPGIDPGALFGLTVQIQSGWLGLGIGYSQAAHKGSWRGASVFPDGIVSRYANLDFQLHARALRRIQPFAQLGVLYCGIAVRDGVADLARDESSDLTYKGWGLNLGAGVVGYLTRDFRITAGVRRHYGFIDRVTGTTLDRSLLCEGTELYLGASFKVGVQAL